MTKDKTNEFCKLAQEVGDTWHNDQRDGKHYFGCVCFIWETAAVSQYLSRLLKTVGAEITKVDVLEENGLKRICFETSFCTDGTSLYSA